MTNILTEQWGTHYGSAPFSDIKTEDFLPAFDFLLEKTKKDIEIIAQNPENPTFENTLGALEFVDLQLNLVTGIIFNLSHAENTPEINEITEKISPILANFSNEIIQNKALFLKIKEIFEIENNKKLKKEKGTKKLTTEQKTILNNRYKEFVRNGAELSPEKQAELSKIDENLASLSVKFGNNVMKDTQNFSLYVENEQDLQGLPKEIIAQAKQRAIAENQADKWLFGLDFPTYFAFVTYCDNRDLRRKMWFAYSTRGFQKNDFNNENVVKSLLDLRFQRAKLLGYDSPAHFTLSERMASTPEIVFDFLEKIYQKAFPVAQKEVKEVEDFAKKITTNLDKLERWDFAYYSEKLKKEKFNIDDELLKPYFEVNQVLNGIFSIAKKLFGLTFEEINIDKYHPDVQVFEVYFSHNFIGVLYLDFFARKNKKSGAWMTSFQPQYQTSGDKNEIDNHRPHISIVCNFPEPTKETPSLLTFGDVTTLFHEFGHALHGLLSQVQYPSTSGTNVKWDFVELPSQFMENWAYQAESLALFAQHYLTKEIIPIEYIQKIKESANFMSGHQTLRQLGFGVLDMNLHHFGLKNLENVNLEDYEKNLLEKYQVLPNVAGVCAMTSFSHIFQGGYSAEYYSYKWAEVLEADAFMAFEEKGIFDAETAQSFKTNILEKGGSENPMTLYENFRGSTPNVDALLKKTGLL